MHAITFVVVQIVFLFSQILSNRELSDIQHMLQYMFLILIMIKNDRYFVISKFRATIKRQVRTWRHFCLIRKRFVVIQHLTYLNKTAQISRLIRYIRVFVLRKIYILSAITVQVYLLNANAISTRNKEEFVSVVK